MLEVWEDKKYDGLIGNSYLPLAVEYYNGIDHGVGGGRNKLENLLIEHNIYYEEDGIIKLIGLR